MITPEDAIDRINGRFGRHPGHRALHAKGHVCAGTFTATPEAAALTRAAHMQRTPVQTTVRFSNAGGDPTVPDYAPDVRGLAVDFHLPDGSTTAIVSQTVPRFPVRTADAFIDLTTANAKDASRLWKLPAFLARNPGVIPTLRPNLAAIKPVAGYLTVRYFAIHAFKWLDADGGERWIRYTWLPVREEKRISNGAAKKRGAEYLGEDLAARIERGEVRMTLQLQIAAKGDDPHDPMSVWPEDRETVNAGTLEVTALDPEREQSSPLIFDPSNLTDGIEPSDDPILAYRSRAYSVSFERRTSIDSGPGE